MEIFTDGAGGPLKVGPERPPRSGWAFVVVRDGATIYEACGPIEPQVTTNAAELEAMLRALLWVHQSPPEVDVITVFSDSRYVTDSCACAAALADREFKLASGAPLPNADRIRLIYDVLYPLGENENVQILHCKGHSGIPGNERADALVTAAAYRGVERSGPPEPLDKPPRKRKRRE